MQPSQKEPVFGVIVKRRDVVATTWSM